MPMVSKITSAFRTWIGSDSSSAGPPPRKRCWTSDMQHAEQDILETPQPKRSKHSHDDLTSSIGKVASWIKQKASSFGENYFFRPVGMENGYDHHPPSECYESEEPGNHQDLKRRPLHQPATANWPIRDWTLQKQDGQKLANGPDARMKDMSPLQSMHKSAPARPPDLTSHKSAKSKSRYQTRPTHRTTLTTHPNHSSGVQTTTTTPTMQTSRDFPPAGSRQYSSVNDKLFPRPMHRPSSLSSSGSRTQSTASECVRLDQLQHYQQLLRQFTTANVSNFSPGDSLLVRDGPQESVRHSAKRGQQESTELGSLITRPQVTANPTLHRTRVLPHEYETQREIREAARQRLHVPVTDLSPSGTPYMNRHTVATPAQPSFTPRSESPVIISIKPAPKRSTPGDLSGMTAFERSLTDTPCAMADWVTNLKERFESSVQLQHKTVEKGKAALTVYKQQRDEQQARISKKIIEDMKTAVRRAAVMEEPPTPEVSEEEAEPELPELTSEMINKINSALGPQPANQMLVEGFKIRLTRADIHTLSKLNWLNDEIINFYMNMLVARGDEEGKIKLHYFNTFFYPKLLKEGQAGLRRWTKKTDIFAKDMILVPIHLGMHWCMAIIDIRKKSITYYDSMGGQNQKCLDALRKYLIAEHRDKKGSPYDMTGWTSSCLEDIPQQLNGSDCGMFACKFAEYVCRDKPITFTQHDMPYFRKRMVWELIHKKLL